MYNVKKMALKASYALCSYYNNSTPKNTIKSSVYVVHLTLLKSASLKVK